MIEGGEDPMMIFRRAPDETREGPRLQQRVSVCAFGPRGIHPARVTARGGAWSLFSEPGPVGFEREVAQRLAWWADLKAKCPDNRHRKGTKAARRVTVRW